MNQNIRIFILSVLFCLSIYLGNSQTCKDIDLGHLMDTGFIQVRGNTAVPINTLHLNQEVRYQIPASGIDVVSSFIFNQNARPTTSILYTIKSHRNANHIVFTINFNIAIQKWTTIRLSYFFSSRNDIYAKQFFVETDSFDSSSAQNQVIESQIFLSNFNPRGRKFRVFVFISGIDIQTGFNVKVYDPFIDTRLSKLYVKVSKSSSTILYILSLSYILFPEDDFQFNNEIHTPPIGGGLFSISGLVSASQSQIGTSQWKIGECGCPSCPRNEQCNLRTKKCDCKNGYERIGGNCLTECPRNQRRNTRNICESCPSNESLNSRTNRCECNNGFERVNGTCRRNCSSNQRRNSGGDCQLIVICSSGQEEDRSGRCVCRSGFERVNGVCVRECQSGFQRVNGNCRQKCATNERRNQNTYACEPIGRCGSNEIQVEGGCLCRPSYVKPRQGNQCVSCLGSSYPDPQQTMCICYNPTQIYNYILKRCVKCPQNAFPSESRDECLCSNGFFLNDGECKPQQFCPEGADLNQLTKTCVCFRPQEFLIHGLCQKCQGNNQIYNGQTCTCERGLYLINNRCQRCDENAVYDGKTCTCKYGYYENLNRCLRCHQTCGQCIGPSKNQCMACSDISYTLNSGECLKNFCPKGTYRSNGNCNRCSQYCIQCSERQVCLTCAHGFDKRSFPNNGLVLCQERCGDGTRYTTQCDDENNFNGDGCSSDCQVEDGWFCSGGTSMGKSTCVRQIPKNSVVTLVGTTNQIHKVFQGAQISYLPECAIGDNCRNCSSLIRVRIIESDVAIVVEVKFIPNSKWQFVIVFDFGPVQANSGFTFVVQFSEQYKDCFNSDDMRQQLKFTVDPTILKLLEHPKVVNLEDLA